MQYEILRTANGRYRVRNTTTGIETLLTYTRREAKRILRDCTR